MAQSQTIALIYRLTELSISPSSFIASPWRRTRFLERSATNCGVDEARAYLSHPVLGPKLNDCRQLVTGVKGKSAHETFGSPDDMKFHSSMTLFNEAEEDVFQLALSKYY
jgi:uncharacterized protein (DUF1810 family)